MNQCRNKSKYIVVIFIILIISFNLNVCIGTTKLQIYDIFYALCNKEDMINSVFVIWQIRLPIAIMAVNVGIALGISGACMQTLLSNYLASPYTLGVSAGAGCGAALALVTGWFSGTVFSEYVTSIFAILAAIIVSLSICILGKMNSFSKHSMILCGIALMFLLQSIQALLQFIADSDVMQSIVFWNFGSLEKSTWNKVYIITMINILIIPLIIKESWNLTTLKLGDVEAKVIGVDVKKLRLKCYIFISIITAISVSLVGSIGFLGIAAPHIARKIVGDDQRYYLIASGMVGAIILSIASILSKLIIPGIVFPIGIITSIIGVPFFALIIFRGGKHND